MLSIPRLQSWCLCFPETFCKYRMSCYKTQVLEIQSRTITQAVQKIILLFYAWPVCCTVRKINYYTYRAPVKWDNRNAYPPAQSPVGSIGRFCFLAIGNFSAANGSAAAKHKHNCKR